MTIDYTLYVFTSGDKDEAAARRKEGATSDAGGKWVKHCSSLSLCWQVSRLRFHSSLLTHLKGRAARSSVVARGFLSMGVDHGRVCGGCVEKLTLFFKAPSSLSHFCTRYQETLHSSVGEARVNVPLCVEGCMVGDTSASDARERREGRWWWEVLYSHVCRQKWGRNDRTEKEASASVRGQEAGEKNPRGNEVVGENAKGMWRTGLVRVPSEGQLHRRLRSLTFSVKDRDEAGLGEGVW